MPDRRCDTRALTVIIGVKIRDTGTAAGGLLGQAVEPVHYGGIHGRVPRYEPHGGRGRPEVHRSVRVGAMPNPCRSRLHGE